MLPAPPWLAFFISRRATPRAVVGAYDVARGLRDAGVAVAGGFDAPVERDCLRFLLRGTQPLLVMPARPLARFRPPATWAAALADGRLRLESPFREDERGTPLANARTRNRALVDRAAAVVVAYAHPGGGVERLALAVLRERAKPVWTLDLPENAAMITAGARPLNSFDSSTLTKALTMTAPSSPP